MNHREKLSIALKALTEISDFARLEDRGDAVLCVIRQMADDALARTAASNVYLSLPDGWTPGKPTFAGLRVIERLSEPPSQED